MPVTCWSCGFVNRADGRYCNGCGRPVAATVPPEVASTSRFVGRQRELTVLHARLDDATQGKGSLAMLVGEAGVGKTQIAREFAGAARARGAIVLWGCCFEGDWSPPYGPWVEALGEYARGADPDRLAQALGAGAPSLAQLIPDLRAALPHLPRAVSLSQDDERFRLYDAVAQLLLVLAEKEPVVLVLDDLHWADRDSLRLLRHVARYVHRARLLIVGAYRDEELDLDPRHPLSDVLAVLGHETEYGQLIIQGLSPTEVAQYLAQAAPQPFPRAVVDAIYAETAGNPFYTREVLRHLVEEGKIVNRKGRWSTDFNLGDLGIPVGVRRVLGRRVSRLSDATNRVLRLAAAFTGGFEFRVLQALADLPEETLLDSIDEALRAGLIRVLDPPTVAYDFAHAIVRHTLYEELNPDRRARLHRRIVTALEQVYAGRTVDHAAELAAQYHASALLPGARDGIPYCLAAAEQARAVHSRERAVRFLRMARDLAARETPGTRAPILGALAVAEADALMLDDAQHTIDEALTAQSDGAAPVEVQAGFLAEVVRALKDGGASHEVCDSLVDRGLALVGDRRDRSWARLMLLHDRLEMLSIGPINAGRWLGYDPLAVAILRSSGDEDDHARTLEPFDWRTRAETDAVYALVRTWKRPAAIMRALDVAARDCIYHHGEIPEAVERLRELLEVSESSGSIPGQAEALCQLALCEAILGDLSRARDTVSRAREMVARLGSVHRLRVVIEAALASVLAYFLGGDWPGLVRATTDFVAFPVTGRGPLGLTAASFAVYNHYRAGNEAEARRYLAAITPLFERLGPTTYIYSGSIDRVGATVWEMGVVEYAPTCRRLALDLVARGEAGSPFRSNALTLARMAALLGDMTEAGAYFDRAREVLDRSGQRPLRAIVEYDEALALFRSGSHDRARLTGLLDESVARFTALGMDDWIGRARILRENRGSLPGARSAAPRVYPDGLTAREVEVLRLIAAGQTNKEIATELIVSVATVQRHVANVYGKINARGRADATSYALGHGLTATRGSLISPSSSGTGLG